MARGKPCSGCRLFLAPDEFSLRKGRLLSRCKACVTAKSRAWVAANPERRRANERRYRKATAPARQKSYERWRRSNPAAVLVCSARARARKKGLPFGITVADVPVPTRCPILGIPIAVNVGNGKGGQANSPSIDRIVPELGYVPGNVVVISQLANMMKSCATTDQLLMFADWIQRAYGRTAVA